MLKIDIHTHILPKEIPNWKERFGYGGFITLEYHKPYYARMLGEISFLISNLKIRNKSLKTFIDSLFSSKLINIGGRFG